ncbi:unnamed protein product [Durusdinium trenchii]|uniref:Uncharacterized protein n=1 Tax=Durusdinium trenchii TaxID=1381693 RepID=A0ABP0REH8_9DINO
MEALAKRVGRFEAELDALRREVLQLQGPHPSKPSSDAQASELQLQWVRLFEKELERLRRLSESYEEPFSVLEHRLSRLESVALPESGRDLDELAELVLSELHDLQQKVRQLGTSSQQRQAGVALHAGHMRASTQPLKLTEGPRNADESPSRSPVGAAVARNEMFQRLEESNASLEARLERLEKEVVPGQSEGHQSLQQRLRNLEEEVNVRMQPLKRHQVSLRVLEETSMKVEKLQDALKLLPIDQALLHSEEALKAAENAARGATGQMSLLDGYKVQSSLDQLFTAMEALVRRRNQDVQLVNGYLREVYQRIERDLPSDKGQSIIQIFEQLQNQQQVLKSECRMITDVRIPELEEKLSHEASRAASLAQGNRQQITRLELATQEAMNQLTGTQARLPALLEASEQRAQQELRRESQVAELRKELIHLRQDFVQ